MFEPLARSRMMLTATMLLAAAGCQSTRVAGIREWPQAAKPVHFSGLPNAYRLSDRLIRGAAPTASGKRELQDLGVKTIVDLRANTVLPAGDVPLGMRYENIPVVHGEIRDRDVVRFLQLASDEAAQPIYLHCRHGSDRTGVFIAAFRTVLQGWSKQAAIKEMIGGGFGYQPLWPEHERYIRELDVERIKAQLNLPVAAAPANVTPQTVFASPWPG